MQRKITWTHFLAIGILSSLVLQACNPQEDCNGCFDPPSHSFAYANHTGHAMLLKEWQRGELSEYNLPPSSELEFKQGLSWGDCDISIDGEEQTSNVRRPHCSLLPPDSLKVVFVDDSTSYLLKQEDSISINILHQNNYKRLDLREDDPVPTDRFVYFFWVNFKMEMYHKFSRVLT